MYIYILVSKVEIYPEKQPNGQWLKSIEFKLPIIKKEMKIFLDNGTEPLMWVRIMEKLEVAGGERLLVKTMG